MITLAKARKLDSVHAACPGVLSLYVAVPLSPTGLRSTLAGQDRRGRCLRPGPRLPDKLDASVVQAAQVPAASTDIDGQLRAAHP
jgi:hypothetical protein